MNPNLNEVATVQYGDWMGEVAADEVDGHELEAFLGFDSTKWRLLVVDITVYGGYQEVHGYGVPASQTWSDLEDRVRANQPVIVHHLGLVDYDPHHGDTNPPAPLSTPVISAGELVGHGFKRLHIRLRSRNLPPGSVLEVAE